MPTARTRPSKPSPIGHPVERRRAAAIAAMAPSSEPERGVDAGSTPSERPTSSVWAVDGAADLLRRMWVEDGASFDAIAAAVSALTGRTVTRSAVSGRVMRLGLMGQQGAGQGGAEPDMGIATSEQDQRVEVVAEAHAEESTLISEPTIVAAEINVAVEPEAASPESGPAEAGKLADEPAPVEQRERRSGAAVAQESAIREPGTWRLAELLEAQCRFACTPHNARPEAHRFCGLPVAWLRGKPISWCSEHLKLVVGAPGFAAGGRSMADVAGGKTDPEPLVRRRDWGGAGGVASR